MPETQTISNFITGGFGIFLFREILTGIKDAYKKRAETVSLARALKADVQDVDVRINEFIAGIDELIASNGGRPKQYRPGFVAPVNLTLSYNTAGVYALIEKHSPEMLPLLMQLFLVNDNYKMLLHLYRETYMGAHGLKFDSDQHPAFKEKLRILGIHKISEIAKPLKAAADTIVEGKGIWRFLRKKLFYYPLKILLLVLLIFIPDRDLI
jgi:hypothetical protein